MSIVKEFKEFTVKGNLIDMSIGIVIGAAFGAVTKTFIEGIFMPFVGLIFKVGDLSHYTIQIGMTADGKPNLIMIGSFIGALINFLIIAFVMFMVIKGMNRMKKKEEEAPAPPAIPAQEQLLTEIRDLLKK